MPRRNRPRRNRRNPPLRRVRQVGADTTEVEHGDVTVLYSYEIPVAVFAPDRGFLKSDKFFSRTTSNHINAWHRRVGGTVTVVPQADIEWIAQHGAGKRYQGFVEAEHRGSRRVNPKGYDNRFTKADVGIYADGGLGYRHVRDVLARMMDAVGEERLADELSDPMDPDVGDEPEQEAIDILQGMTEAGLMWGMVDGDLLLQTEEWWEDA